MATPRGGGGEQKPWEYRLRKYLLLLATLVATVTYGAGFNPPGGVWQDADPAAHRIAGDPIIRETHRARYLAFFYANATALASSLVVIVLVLVLAVLHEAEKISTTTQLEPPVLILRAVMVLDLLSLMAAYAAGAFRDTLTKAYSVALLAVGVLYLAVHTLRALASSPEQGAPGPTVGDGDGVGDSEPERRRRKVLMLLATFAVSVTYVAGLSAPGGFWDKKGDGHDAGDAVLKGGPHDGRLKAFFVCNTTAFVASLLVIVLLLDRKLHFSKTVQPRQLYLFFTLMLGGLVAAYAAGSSRDPETTIFVTDLVAAVLAFIVAQLALSRFDEQDMEKTWLWGVGKQVKRVRDEVSEWLTGIQQSCLSCLLRKKDNNGSKDKENEAVEQSRSLVLLLATLAASITYQAGLNPPGGLWQQDGRRYKAGDPILLTANPRRYKAFYYFNSVAFVASLVAVALVRRDTLHQHNALEAAMVLDLFGLMGAYAAGSCRDVSTSVYAVALAGAVLVYVVIHVVLFTLDAGKRGNNNDADSAAKKEREAEEKMVQKRRKRLLLFAILGATVTYQAGLTPPGGFLAKDDGSGGGHRAGDPVLLSNFPRRYTAFFYCNSVSFMLSMALIILFVNPNLYRPAIRSYALSVCTAAGMMGIMGAYAAGSTQHLQTSYYIFALATFVFFLVIVAVLLWVVHERRQRAGGPRIASAPPERTADNEAHHQSGDRREGSEEITEEAQNVAGETPTPSAPETRPEEAEQGEVDDKKFQAEQKYRMLLGILVASVTYQAGLSPPGGVWQANGGGHEAGAPVTYDNRRPRYLAFYYCNSTSFVASIAVIVFLLPSTLHKEWWRPWWRGVMDTTILLELLGLLIAYAAGSSRSLKTAINVSGLVVAVLGYFVIHVMVSSCFKRREETNLASASHQPDERAAAAC